MRAPTHRFLPVLLVASAMGLICPLAGAAINPSPTSLTFCYIVGSVPPSQQFVELKDSITGNPVTVTSAVLAQGAASPFTEDVSNGVAYVAMRSGFNAQNGNVYSDTLTLNGTYLVSVSLSTQTGCGSGGGSTGTITASPPSLSLSALAGASNSAIVYLTSNSSVSVTVVPQTGAGASGWLSTSATALNLTASTPAPLTVTVSAGSLAAGVYSGTVSIQTGGATAATITVQFQVSSGGGSSGGGLTASSLNLQFSGTNTQTSALTQQVTLGGQIGQTYTVQSVTSASSTWLSVTPATGIVGTDALTVTARPSGLSAGSYSGSAYVTTSTGWAFLNITMTVSGAGGGSGGLTASPASLQFYSYNNQAQTVTLGGLTGQGFSVSLPANQSWLSVAPSSGIVGTNNLTVTTVPGSLATGTYTANITVSSGSASATIPVTLTVASSGSVIAPIVAPTALTFWYQNNSGAPVWPQQVLLSGAPGAAWSVSASGGSWLSTDQTSGTIPATGFQPVTVRVAAASAAVGSSSGTVSVTVGAQTAAVTVNLNVVSSPVLVPLLYGGSGDVVAIYTVGQQFPFIPIMQVGSSGSPVTVSASTSSNWISITTDQNTTPTNLTIAIDPTKLSNGLNTGSIAVAGTASGQQVIPVIVGVAGGFTLDQASLSFSAPQGGSSQTQVVHLTGITTSTFTTTINTATGANWLSVSPASGTAGTTATSLTITANPAGLSPGTYSGSVTVTVGSTSQSVGVTFTVTSGGGGTITTSPASLAFQYTVGGSQPAAQGLSLAVSGANSVSFTAQAATTSGGNWLAVAPVSGSAPITLQVSATPGNLAPGTYNGTITVTPAGGTALSPVNVTLTVNAATAPGISVSPSSLQFNYDVGAAAPAAQALHVTSAGAGIQFAAASSAGWLIVSPASGTVPGDLSVTINTANLAAGTYSGTITVTPANSTPAQTVNVSLTVTAPLPTITSVKNAASYSANAIAPGEIVAIFGSQMGPATGQTLTLDQTGKVSTTLANTQVLFNGIAAPVVYASASQVNAVAPYQLSGRTSAVVQVTYAGVGSNSVSMPVTTTVPGLFTQNASGMGPGAILNADLSLNTSGNPAAKGSTIVIYMTGEGQTSPAGINGLVTAGPTYPMPILPVTVLIDGQPTNVTFAGEAPSLVSGVLQVNATVPPTARSGDVPIIVSVGPNPSQLGVTVSVK